MNFSAGSRQTSVTGTTTLLLAVVVALLAVLAAPALAASECPGANEGNAPSLPSEYTIVLDNDTTENYSQSDLNDTVLPAGTHVCVKGGNGATGIVVADGEKTLYQILNGSDEGPNVSHYMTYTKAEVALSGECDEATVTITNPNETFTVDVTITDADDSTALQETISASKTYPLTEGQTLTTSATGDQSVTWEDCSTPEEPEPSVGLSTACDGTQPTATVTIDNDGDEDFEVEVFIDNVSQGTISETTTVDGDAMSVLRVEWGEDESDEVQFEECIEPEFLESTASFTVGSECQENLPVLTYDATISETADDPVGDVTLTVSDASGELGEATFSESEAGSIVLAAVLEGETVNASWDFDGTTLEQTLASDCSDVLGATDEREDDPDTLPATEVKGEQIGSEQLPNTGAEHVILLVLGSALIALGGFFLRVSDRRQTVLG